MLNFTEENSLRKLAHMWGESPSLLYRSYNDIAFLTASQRYLTNVIMCDDVWDKDGVTYWPSGGRERVHYSRSECTLLLAIAGLLHEGVM